MKDFQKPLKSVEQTGERMRYEKIIEHIPDDVDTILNIGATEGSHVSRQKGSLHQILHHNLDADIVGIDIVESEVKRMQRNGYDVRVGDMQKTQKAVDQQFDVVIAGEVIEHVPHPGQALESVYDVLKPGGKLILTTPNPDGFVYYRRALLNQGNTDDHTCWIDPQNMLQLAKVVDVDYRIGKFELLPVTWGISKLIWLAGFQRAAASGYLIELTKK